MQPEASKIIDSVHAERLDLEVAAEVVRVPVQGDLIEVSNRILDEMLLFSLHNIGR